MITNLDALKANISDAHGVILTENHFMKALIDQGLVTDAQYTDSSAINSATLALYDVIIESAGFSEGGLSYSVNIEGVKQAKAALEKRMGLTDDKNEIKSPKVW